MNINDIKPGTQGISDKYSWNLYAYLKKNKGEHRILWNTKDGKPLHPMNVYVLDNANFGTTLLRIVHGTAQRVEWAKLRTENYMDITVGFWESYEANGRCVFHSHNEAWLVGSNQRFQSINEDSNRCLWCGAVLRRIVKTTKVIRRTQHWEVVYS